MPPNPLVPTSRETGYAHACSSRRAARAYLRNGQFAPVSPDREPHTFVEATTPGVVFQMRLGRVLGWGAGLFTSALATASAIQAAEGAVDPQGVVCTALGVGLTMLGVGLERGGREGALDDVRPDQPEQGSQAGEQLVWFTDHDAAARFRGVVCSPLVNLDHSPTIVAWAATLPVSPHGYRICTGGDLDSLRRALATPSTQEQVTGPAGQEQGQEQVRVRLRNTLASFETICCAYDDLLLDPFAVLEHAQLLDPANAHTAAFLTSYGEALDTRAGLGPHEDVTLAQVQDLERLVREADQAWQRARTAAARVRFDFLAPADARRARHAHQLLVMAAHESGELGERAAAAEKAAGLLRAISGIVIPEPTVQAAGGVGVLDGPDLARLGPAPAAPEPQAEPQAGSRLVAR